MLKKLCMVTAAIALTATVSTGASALEAKLEPVASGLTHPMQLLSPPDGSKRRFIVEQIGTIKILQPNGELAGEDFLNIKHKIVEQWEFFDEEGLLGMAFHPDFKKNGLFYVAYSSPLFGNAGVAQHLWYAHTNVVAEYRVSKDDPNIADPNYERIVMATHWPQFNHNGHWIDFGPDKMLYVSMGDGGYANDWGIGHNPETGNGQDMTSTNGKILRIDVNVSNDGGDPYKIPKDNPFVGNDEVAPEIWASGFRNPWRCSFDMGGKNELFCGDVGQNSYEEIDIVVKGGNYGWRVKEGTKCFNFLKPNDHPASCEDTGMIDPIIEYNNCGAKPKGCKGISITGGYVYRGANKAWDGKYFFGDWSKSFAVKDGQLFAGTNKGGKWSMEDVNITNMPGWNEYVMAFGQDDDGEIYVMGTNVRGPVGQQDTVYKIVP